MVKKRDNFVSFYIGHNRTGKTVLAKELAKFYKKNNPKNDIIIFDPQNRFNDIATQTIYSDDFSIFFDEDLQTPNIYDTLFIFDDYRALMDKNTTDKLFLKLLMQRNEYGLDFIFITHSPKLIHERISYYITNFNIFYTSGDPTGFLESGKIPASNELYNISNFVNTYVKKYGKGSYDKNKNFPFVSVDVEKEVINFINFENIEIKNKEVIIK